MRTPKSILISLAAWFLGKTTFSASAMEKAEARADAEVSTFRDGQRVRLTSVLYGTSEEGILLSSTPVRGATYGTHTIRKDDGNKYRTQGTLENPSSTATDEDRA